MLNLCTPAAEPAPAPMFLHAILLVDEDPAARAFLAENLAADGYAVTVAEDRDHALALLNVTTPDLIIVDVNGETLGLLDAVRSADGFASRIDPDTPLVTLTGRAGELHRIRVLERGGDDVIAKPFSYPELRARITAILRRCARTTTSGPVLRAGPVTVDTRTRAVRVLDRPLELTGREYDLLRTLATEPTRVFTRAELLRGVWGYRTPSRTLDSHACRLRRKLERAGAGALLANVWGVGYRLCDPGSLR